MKRHAKRIGILLAGIIFLVVGAAGLVLPFLQGILFIAIGLLLLSLLSPGLRVFLERHTVKWPSLHKVVLRIDEWLRRTVGEM